MSILPHPHSSIRGQRQINLSVAHGASRFGVSGWFLEIQVTLDEASRKAAIDIVNFCGAIPSCVKGVQRRVRVAIENLVAPLGHCTGCRPEEINDPGATHQEGTWEHPERIKP